MIYLDNSAGTRPYPEVIETITNVLTNHWGNASADYSFGQDAKIIIDNITEQVANDINCDPAEIIWTSGACEANSLAINGFMQRYFTKLYASKLEHTSINKLIEQNEDFCGFIDNDKQGFILIQSLEKELSEGYNHKNREILVSISAANSEIGVIQDIKSIADVVHKYNGVFHVDATQLYPWERIDVQKLGIDMMSVSGQKLHCCKGIGFLYVRDGIKLNPLIYGSQQELRRGGTYPTHLIAAFGKALEITRERDTSNIVREMRNKIMKCLVCINGVTFNGPISNIWRLPNNISATIDSVSAEQIVAMCDEVSNIFIAKGSACNSYNSIPSKTLLSIGRTNEEALSTIRITLDEFNTWDEINYFCEIFPKIVNRLREMSVW